MYPKAFAEVMGSVPGVLVENEAVPPSEPGWWHIDESGSTRDRARVRTVAQQYTRKVCRDKSKTTPCFDAGAGPVLEPGHLGRTSQLRWPLTGQGRCHRRGWRGMGGGKC